MTRWRDLGPLLAWFGSLAAGIVLFTQLGDGPLVAPPVTEPGAWSAWAEGRDPVVAGLALLRLLVLALTWYLVGVTTIGLIARLLRLGRLVRLADAMSGPVVRHVLRSALGVSLAVGVVASSAGAGPRTAEAGDARGEVATAVALVDDEDGHTATVRTVSTAQDAAGTGATVVASPLGDDVVTMSPLAPGGATAERGVGLPPGAPTVTDGEAPDEEASDEVAPDGEAPDGEAPDGEASDEVADGAPSGADAAEPGTTGEHEVVAGEHLWSIAAEAVGASLDREPTDAEVHAYWQVLIDDNRDRLADPDNPDLLFPGQRLVLPDAPGGSEA